jgi:hypothetical protein
VINADLTAGTGERILWFAMQLICGVACLYLWPLCLLCPPGLSKADQIRRTRKALADFARLSADEQWDLIEAAGDKRFGGH